MAAKADASCSLIMQQNCLATSTVVATSGERAQRVCAKLCWEGEELWTGPSKGALVCCGLGRFCGGECEIWEDARALPGGPGTDGATGREECEEEQPKQEEIAGKPLRSRRVACPDVFQSFAQIAQQMETIGDLHGSWRNGAGSFGVGPGTIPADHFRWGMLTQPFDEGVGLEVASTMMVLLD